MQYFESQGHPMPVALGAVPPTAVAVQPTGDQWLDISVACAHLDWGNEQPDGYLDAVKAVGRAAIAVSAVVPSAVAAPAEPIDTAEAWRHLLNEWQDFALNGLQWIRNIADGTSDANRALDNMNQCLAYVRGLPLPAAPGAALPAAPRDAAALYWVEREAFVGDVQRTGASTLDASAGSEGTV